MSRPRGVLFLAERAKFWESSTEMPGSVPRSLFVVAALLLPSCGNDDVAAPDSNNGAAGKPSVDADIRFCDALAVIRAKCQRCHTDPPQQGAPVPFLTYEDTQAPYGASETYADRMLIAVEGDIMPPVGFNDPPVSIKPPVEPLTINEKATLLGWLKQGAKPVGGTDCP